MAELVQPNIAAKMDQPWESVWSSGLQQSRCQIELETLNVPGPSPAASSTSVPRLDIYISK